MPTPKKPGKSSTPAPAKAPEPAVSKPRPGTAKPVPAASPEPSKAKPARKFASAPPPVDIAAAGALARVLQAVSVVAKERFGEGNEIGLRPLLILAFAAANPDASVRGMAKKFEVPKPSITRGLDRLQQLALIRREICHEDRRGPKVVLQDDGLRFLDHLFRISGLPRDAEAETIRKAA